MAQRHSGYDRRDADHYPTPPWVTRALLRHHKPRHYRQVWEPAAGTGEMADELVRAGYNVHASDIRDTPPVDFLAVKAQWNGDIITNPPFGLRGKLAEAFIAKALELTGDSRGSVAMLLPADFHHARSRTMLFGACNIFAGMVVLIDRPKWFEGEADPSTNFSWFIWDWSASSRIHPPVIHFAGNDEKGR